MGIFLPQVQQHLHHALLTTLTLSLPFLTGVQRWMHFSIDALPKAGPAARLCLTRGPSTAGQSTSLRLGFPLPGQKYLANWVSAGIPYDDR